MTKYKLITALILILAFSANAQHEHFVCKDMHGLMEMEKHHGESIMKFVANPLTQNYDLRYHRFEWLIDPAQLYISGEITTYFVPLVANFQQIYFDMNSNLSINSVQRNGQNLLYSQQSGDILVVDFPTALSVGQLDSIVINYQGAPSGSGFGAFANGNHNGTPVLWTLSEPYGAKEWWPCKQDLNDKIDSIDIFVTTPMAYKAASNGILYSETTIGSSTKYHWKHRYPIPAYLVAIAVTNYSVYSDYVPVPNASSVEVLNYVYPEQAAAAQTQTSDIIEIMQLFNNLFGLYPFADEKYGHAQFGWGGGMEHQTMSFMGGFSYGLQAHELAHQWFGDKITCGSWKDIWLNEGFATYLTGLTREHLGSQLDWMNWKENQITTICSQPDGSVWVDDTTSVGRIFSGRLSYAKGSMLLHMLRWVVGDDDFYLAINNYQNDPNLAFSYAHTANLQAHLEAQSGLSLTEFFNDWFYGEGYPSYDISTVVNGNQLDITVYQIASDPSVSFFEMPLPIYVSGQGMDSTLRLDHTFSGQTFQVTLPFQVDSVAFDPELWIISNNNTQGLLVGVEPVYKEAFIETYPNPASTHLNVESSEAIQTIELFDNLGVMVMSSSPDINRIRIDIDHLSSGIYSVRIACSDQIIVRQIIKK
jgi:aminopeptidase N